MTPARRLRLGALLAVAIAHLLVSLFAVVPGHLSIDEATYHLMAKNQSERRGYELWNGYRELPSPELVSSSIVAHGPALVGRPPVLHPALAVPFYRLAGYRGLFALNALAFTAAAGLLFLLARRLFADVDLALDSVLILLLATFAWEYSQAAWTHATALLFTLGAFTLAAWALLEARPRRAAALAGAAGLVAGFAVGIRLDSVFLLTAILLLFLFRSPWQPGRALAVLGGAAPGLAFLATINQRRFGTWSPLSMGKKVGVDNLARYLPLLALGTLSLAVLWGLTRRPVRRWLSRRRGAALVAAGLILAALVVPASRRVIARQARGAYTLGVDLRALDLERREPAMRRSDNRAVIYIDGLKKSLLQSCPYLPLLLLPAIGLTRRRALPAAPDTAAEAGRLAILFAVPLVYFGFYAQFSWHGGLSLNLRYLTTILPYTSILTAWALRQPRARPHGWRDALLAAVAASALFVAVRFGLDGISGDELLVLTLPMALAGALLIALLAALRRQAHGDGSAASSRRAVAALAAAALVWAGLTAFAYDLPLVRQTRRFHLETGQRASQLVADDSLFFADFVDPFFLLVERHRVRIARPGLDRYRDMPRLAAFHLDAGRGVYGAFPAPVWKGLAAGPLEGFAVTPLWHAELFVLARIERDEAAAATGGAG